jgi:hypothetical protein
MEVKMYKIESHVSLSRKFIIGGLIALCLSLFYVSNAKSQTKPEPGCKLLKDATEFIEKKHGENNIFRGLSRKGHLTFIYYNSGSGTWTAAIVRPSNPTQLCIVDDGTTGEVIHKDNVLKKLW